MLHVFYENGSHTHVHHVHHYYIQTVSESFCFKWEFKNTHTHLRSKVDRFRSPAPAGPTHKCFLYAALQRQTRRPILYAATANYLAGLIIMLRNAVWSLGRWGLIALDHNELLENRFV